MKITKDELQALLTPGNWFQFPRQFLQSMSATNAVLLAHLLNRCMSADVDDEGWFTCSVGAVERKLFFTEDQQKRAFHYLQEAGLIETSKCIRANRRKVRLRIFDIYEMIKGGGERTLRGEGAKEPSRGGERTPMRGRKNPDLRVDTVLETNKNTCAHGARAEGKGFFGSNPKTFEEVAAIKLEEILRVHRKIDTKPNRKKWMTQIRAVLKMVGGDEKRVKRAIVWYGKNINSQFAPRIFNAVSFRDKFPSIEAQMEREGEKRTPVAAKDIKYTAKEKELFAYLKDEGWPKGSASSLLECIHHSLESYGAWYKRVQKTKENPDTPQRVRAFIEDLQYSVANNPHSFVRAWFAQVAKRVRTWKDWNGDLRYYIFSVEHKEFMNMGLAEATRYTGPSSAGALWELLLKTVNEN